MELDIGGRQTGKTTRLVYSVVEYLTNNPNNTAVIVALNGSQRSGIKNMVHHKCGDCSFRVMTSHKMLPGLNDISARHFVDELGAMKGDDVFVDINAYYNSSIYKDDPSNHLGWHIVEDLKHIWSKDYIKPVKMIYRHGLS